MSAEETIHLHIESGPDKGRRLSIPVGGARVGRSSSNDVVLGDDALSRFHCRFYFKENQLWVADLGSTNETLVNHKPIQDRQLSIGDRVAIGDTVMVVAQDQLTPGAVAAPPPVAPPPPKATPREEPDGQPVSKIDLGFGPAEAATTAPAGPRKLLFAVVVLAVFAIAVAGLIALQRRTPTRKKAEERVPELTIRYEKVEASSDNIFRFALTIDDHVLSAHVDHLEDNKHVEREARLSESAITSLAASIFEAGFFNLQESYQGLTREVWDAWDLSVTIDKQTHRVKILNRLEPDRFRAVREIVEEFAKTELGLMALALPPEELLELARDAVLQGQKLYDQRDVRYDNLALAVRAFDEAQWYLETIEPKPDFYETAVVGLEGCRRELSERYEDELFRAERAIKLKDWPAAAEHLRTIILMIPERADERHTKAERKLMEVERRLKR